MVSVLWLFSQKKNTCEKYNPREVSYKSHIIKEWFNEGKLKIKLLKGPFSGLRQFLAAESPLKMIKNYFYLILKVLSVLKIFTLLSWLFGVLGKRLEKKSKVNFKTYDVTDWNKINKYNTHIAKYLKK